ncbi:swr1 complex component [Xylographa opegraphella]|nr:swr1 complex component [Xylographa opegraphella]
MQNGLNHNLHNEESTKPRISTTTTSGIEVRVPPLPTQDSQRILSNDESSCENHSDGRPNKRRKLTNVPIPQRSISRPVSPPWKKIAVDGPTSFVEGGRRKSSRTNAIPLELQPQSDKRRTRARNQQTDGAPKSKHGGVRNHISSPQTPSSSKLHVNGKASSSKSTAQPASKSPAKPYAKNVYTSKSTNTDSSTPLKRSHKKKHLSFQELSASPPPQSRSPQQKRRVSEHVEAGDMKDTGAGQETNGWRKDEDESESEEEEDDDGEEDEDDEEAEDDMEEEVPYFKPQRLNLRVSMPTVTIQHPLNVVPTKRYPSFREWLKNDDPLQGTDSAHLTERQAMKEARMRERISRAARPGGVLTIERCSMFIPEPQDEPPQQYSHQDHLVAHTIYFRKLMNKEHRDHVTMARKTANAAVEKWRYNDPRTIAETNRRYWDTVYKPVYLQCVRDLSKKWELFRGEVRQRQLKAWEEEQDALGKEALDKVLEESSRLLDKRRRRSSAGASTMADGDNISVRGGQESESEEGESQSDTEDEKNMSSSHSGSEEDLYENSANDDDGLTVDEIRRKYVDQPSENLDRPPDRNFLTCDVAMADEKGASALHLRGTPESLPKQSEPHEEVLPQEFPLEMDDIMLDQSDESTDMNDSDDSESDEDEDSDEGSSESDEDRGLLGFFSEKDTEAPTYETIPAAISVIEEDIEEVSLIPDAIQVPTPSASNSETPSFDLRKDIKHTLSDDDSQMLLPVKDTKAEQSCSGNTLTLIKPSPLANLTNLDQFAVESNSLPATPVSTKPLRTQVPSLLRGTLREYQHYGLDWLAGLYANGTNGILADEMGLGKTIQTISLLAHLAVEHEDWGPHLIVVPTSVMLNWEMEFKKFLPGFKILTYYGTQEERKQKRKGWLDNDKWNVCITSYQLVLQDQQTFKRRAWHYLVLDEAHNIKNFRSQRWQTLLTFRTQGRLLLTGTPLQNNLTELWSLLFFLMPSDSTDTGIAGFAGLQDFTSWFKKPVDQILEQGRETMDDEAKELVHRLHGVLRPFLLRRLKADVEKQMPGKYEHVVYCKLSKRQRYLYDGFMSRTQTRETLAHGNYLSIINCLMQLRKVCNHPDLFETRQIVTSFAMPKSAVADFEIKELLVRRRLLRRDIMQEVNLDVINLLPGANVPVSALDTIQNSRLGALGRLRQLVNQQFGRILPNMKLDGTTVDSTLAFMENNARSSALEDLRHCAYLTSLKSQRRPLYSHSLMERLRIGVKQLPTSPTPQRKAQPLDWYSDISPVMEDIVLTLPQRSEMMINIVQKFACITPAVVAPGINSLALSHRGIEVIQEAKQMCPEDAFHEARMRLSIAFPDKRLLQYDCGKLQRLDKLLRTLQAGGHRALIFTQMTKVLDILEQFLNIHGHRYLRLDGATKIEQRQILTDRFNNDDRILVFILSSRSGGLGINLTGADTVIFYDLDWNPAMDKQCQDRCHRIGQTRDVHIYRFVSEHTIEANILRKANQKRMLDDVVIQEGDFTTDYFNKPNMKDVLEDESLGEGDAEASAAMDRVLGAGPGHGKLSTRIFDQVEDKEDTDAAKVAEKEMAQSDDVDFDEKTASGGRGTPRIPGSRALSTRRPESATGSLSTPTGDDMPPIETVFVDDETLHAGVVEPSTSMAAEIFNEKEGIGVDHYIVGFLENELKDVPVAPPVDKVKSKSKKGSEHKVRKVK